MDGFDTAERAGPEDPGSAYLPGQELVPAYLASSYAAQYRAIVEVLLAEQDTSLTGLSYDEVATAVRAHLAQRVPADAVAALIDPQVLHLDARLERFERWHVVIRWQEPARTGEDFLRRRDRYRPTPIAARLHSFWSEADDTKEAAGDLTLAPRAILDRLVSFAAAIRCANYRTAAAEFQQISTLRACHTTENRSASRTWRPTRYTTRMRWMPASRSVERLPV